MKEIRLTFATEGLEAVSKVLVDMGIGFRVEPLGAAARQEAKPAAEPPPAPRKRAPAKTARKASKVKRAARSEEPAPADDASLAGAERLRAAIARTGTTYRSPLEPSGASEPAGPAGEASGSERPNETGGN